MYVVGLCCDLRVLCCGGLAVLASSLGSLLRVVGLATMDKDKNTMHLPTVAKTSIDKRRKFDRGDHVQLLKYLRGEVLDVSKFARSFSRAAVTPWESSMPSATAHLVALLGHEKKDRHKYDDKEHIAGAIEAARSRGFSGDYFASLLVVVTPDDKVISIVGHRLLEDDIVKQHLHALPKGTYLHWLNFNANKMDYVVNCHMDVLQA